MKDKYIVLGVLASSRNEVYWDGNNWIEEQDKAKKYASKSYTYQISQKLKSQDDLVANCGIKKVITINK